MAFNIPCICYWYIAWNNWHIFLQFLHAKTPVFSTGLLCNSYHYFLKMLQVYCFNNWHIFLQLLQAKHLHFWQGIPVMATNIPCICYWYISLKIGIFSCSYYMQTPVFSTGFSCFGCRKIWQFFFVNNL